MGRCRAVGLSASDRLAEDRRSSVCVTDFTLHCAAWREHPPARAAVVSIATAQTISYMC